MTNTRSSSIGRTLACALAVLLWYGPATMAQEVIPFMSGNGSVGGTDSQITMLVAPTPNAGFPGVLTTTEFLNATVGPPAPIPVPGGGWLGALSFNPAAQWIATSLSQTSMDSALFAVNLNITTTTISYCELNFYFAIDDFWGDAVNEGIFVNFTPVPGTNPTNLASAWAIENSFQGVDITNLVVPGLNTLIFYCRDTAGIGGALFAGEVVVHSAPAILIPLTPTLGGLGLLQINGGGIYAGSAFLAAPALAPPFPAGLGIPVGPNQFLLDTTDPLLMFALNDPTSAAIWPSLSGTISPVNGLGAVLMNVPNDPALSGLTMFWQGIIMQGGVPVIATSTATMTIQ